jgi:thioredoxin reductase (NADPH)
VEQYAVVIVGGGVAGLSAAIFLARAQVGVAVFDRAESSLYRVSRVNNYLGFPDGVGGAALIDFGRRQAQAFGAALFDQDVRSIERGADAFAVTAEARTLRAGYLVLASNKRVDLARSLGLELAGHGARFVSADADGRTPIERLYAVGRITGAPSQAIISAGDGARAAIDIIQRIRGGYYVDHDT